jgi:hypothetical protein
MRHRLLLADSAGSTKAPEAGIREDCDELANDRKGRSTACYFAFVIGKSSAIPGFAMITKRSFQY